MTSSGLITSSPEASNPSNSNSSCGVGTCAGARESSGAFDFAKITVQFGYVMYKPGQCPAVISPVTLLARFV